ncbi:MAG: PAS domain-containing protein [Bacteroidetes bacterium]|nr:PAS domain-containing protein [Bacteroidota bacterium]
MNTNVNDFSNIVEWAKELNLAITVTDKKNEIIYMNDKSKTTFPTTNIGDKLDNCHSKQSNEIISKMLENNISNTYTVQKNGVKKLIHQTPWYKNGAIAGLVELSIILPDNMPHHNRDK